MPALLLTVALATGQPSSEAGRAVDPAASAQVVSLQDLSAVVSGAPPFAPPVTNARRGAVAGSVTIRQPGGSGLVSTSIDTGANSAALAATAVSVRLVLPGLAAALP